MCTGERNVGVSCTGGIPSWLLTYSARGIGMRNASEKVTEGLKAFQVAMVFSETADPDSPPIPPVIVPF